MNDGIVAILWMMIVGLVVTVIVFAAGANDRAAESFIKECKQVSGEVRTDQDTKRLLCFKDGNLIAKFGVNSPKAPLVKVG